MSGTNPFPPPETEPEERPDDDLPAEILSRYDPAYAARRRQQLGEEGDRLSAEAQEAGQRRLARMQAREAERRAALARREAERSRRERRLLLGVALLVVLLVAAVLLLTLGGA